MFPATSIHLAPHFTSAIHGHVTVSKTVVVQFCSSNKLFLSSGLFAFMSSYFHRLCWPEHKGQIRVEAVFAWGASSDSVTEAFPFEKGGFTLGGGLELHYLSGIAPTIGPYIVFANKAFSSTKPAKSMKVGSVPARVNEPTLSAHLDCRLVIPLLIYYVCNLHSRNHWQLHVY